MGNIEDTPLGTIWIATSEAGMVAVSLWQERSRFEEDVKQLTGAKPRFDFESVASIGEQIDAYLHGELQRFDVRINWSVLTPFQEMALREVHEIPYGRLATYGDIARRIGKPRGVRAVGRANATNPMPIVIPCHRVIGTDGRLHGYGAPGGLETKAWLLRLEGSWLL
jgi:methylated-DNA-[protein]-cysteine S-methyltransferase